MELVSDVLGGLLGSLISKVTARHTHLTEQTIHSSASGKLNLLLFSISVPKGYYQIL